MTHPDRIYLQYDDEPAPDYEHEGATWCEDRINDSDVEYVLATPERLAAWELLAAAVQAATVMNAFGNITNWPPDMPLAYAKSINELRAAIATATPEEPAQ